MGDFDQQETVMIPSIKEIFETAVELHKMSPDAIKQWDYRRHITEERIGYGRRKAVKETLSLQSGDGRVRIQVVHNFDEFGHMRRTFWPCSIQIDSQIIYPNQLTKEDVQLLENKLRMVFRPLFEALAEKKNEIVRQEEALGMKTQLEVRQLIESLGAQ